MIVPINLQSTQIRQMPSPMTRRRSGRNTRLRSGSAHITPQEEPLEDDQVNVGSRNTTWLNARGFFFAVRFLRLFERSFKFFFSIKSFHSSFFVKFKSKFPFFLIFQIQ